MYKVFFNDRTIYLDDTLPDMTRVGKDYVCAFENVTDLKPQVRQFLHPDKTGNLYIFHDDQDSLFKTFSQCFALIPAAGGLVRNGRGELLVIFRRGKWDLPKGKAEKGESMEQTALREVEEECGLKGIELQEFLRSTYHIYEGSGSYVLKKTDWFSMLYTGSETPKPQTREDITEVRWIGPPDLDEITGNTYLSIKELIGGAF
jgi:8-oxo-dGTP pyrophosphatase MutT (NUDIX family)